MVPRLRGDDIWGKGDTGMDASGTKEICEMRV